MNVGNILVARVAGLSLDKEVIISSGKDVQINTAVILYKDIFQRSVVIRNWNVLVIHISTTAIYEVDVNVLAEDKRVENDMIILILGQVFVLISVSRRINMKARQTLRLFGTSYKKEIRKPKKADVIDVGKATITDAIGDSGHLIFKDGMKKAICVSQGIGDKGRC